MKTVYVVRGSEDGNIGVFTNKKLAHQKAVSYITLNGSNVTDLKGKKLKYPTYSQICKRFKKYDFVQIEFELGGSHNICTAEIEAWELNYDNVG